jgi:basic amino acid/polyamine antiporter, APA family
MLSAAPGNGSAARRPRPLAHVLGPVRFFAVSFGCIVGSGWVIVLGDWLKAAGPGGVVLGMLVGGTVLLANSGAYAELIARYPKAGGEFLFARHVFGDRTAFLVGWLSTLSLLAVVAFEATALPWVLETLVPQIKGRTLYVALQVPVTLDALLIGFGGTIVVALLNFRGVRSAASMQTILSFAFLALAVLIVALGFAYGSFHNLAPLLYTAAGKPWWVGCLWIFAITPFFLNGFQSVAQTVEERDASVTFARVAASMALALTVSIGFYCLVTLAAASAQPWQTLINQPLATAAAFDTLLPHHLLSALVLITAALAIVRVWNGAAIWTARLLMAQARAGFLPARLGAVHERYGSPAGAVIFVGICNAVGVVLGKGAIVPLVDMAALCLASNLVLASIAALRVRRTERSSALPYATPGGVATLTYALIGSGAMTVYAFVDPMLRRPDSIPLEWIVIAVWGTLGAVFWCLWRPSHRQPPSS